MFRHSYDNVHCPSPLRRRVAVGAPYPSESDTPAKRRHQPEGNEDMILWSREEVQRWYQNNDVYRLTDCMPNEPLWSKMEDDKENDSRQVFLQQRHRKHIMSQHQPCKRLKMGLATAKLKKRDIDQMTYDHKTAKQPAIISSVTVPALAIVATPTSKATAAAVLHLNDVSRINRLASRGTLREQMSNGELYASKSQNAEDTNLKRHLGDSWTSAPMHSTFCYPLHSTMVITNVQPHAEQTAVNHCNVSRISTSAKTEDSPLVSEMEVATPLNLADSKRDNDVNNNRHQFNIPQNLRFLAKECSLGAGKKLSNGCQNYNDLSYDDNSSSFLTFSVDGTTKTTGSCISDSSSQLTMVSPFNSNTPVTHKLLSNHRSAAAAAATAAAAAAATSSCRKQLSAKTMRLRRQSRCFALQQALTTQLDTEEIGEQDLISAVPTCLGQFNLRSDELYAFWRKNTTVDNTEQPGTVVMSSRRRRQQQLGHKQLAGRRSLGACTPTIRSSGIAGGRGVAHIPCKPIQNCGLLSCFR